MRRLLAILLMLLFSFPLVSPLLALDAQPEANLPACCRRGGIHHCMGMAATASGAMVDSRGRVTQVGIVRGHCPFNLPASASRNIEGRYLHQALSYYADVVHHPAVHAQTEAWARVALEGSRHKRGPPATPLS
ncbi:MAG: hypothetical protein KGK08_00450 [Acidobacteriota bacterium]|nr:hypothetical protein [Acidobacteriota bacterium]